MDLTRAPQLSDLTEAPHVGAVRSNPWYAGWTMLSQSGLLKATDTQAINVNVALEVDGSDLLVKFDTQNNVKYSVERSTDNRKYAQFATVNGTGAAATVRELATAPGSTPKFYRVIAF
jgi:hypothetical protein